MDFQGSPLPCWEGGGLFIFHRVVGPDADDRGWDLNVFYIITTTISDADLLELHAEKSYPLSITACAEGHYTL